MRHSARRLGMAIALIAGVSINLEAQPQAVTLDDYVRAMESEGWAVQRSVNLAGNVTIELSREQEGPERHGLLRIPWDNRVNWKFTYSPQADDTLRILSAEGERMHKAPIFGKWKTVEKYDAIPEGILERELGYGAQPG